MSEALNLREVRYQWVELMCSLAGLGKKRHYEDLFDGMLDQHNREVAIAALLRARKTLDLENLASERFIASDGVPSVGINTNEDAKNKVVSGLNDQIGEYLYD